MIKVLFLLSLLTSSSQYISQTSNAIKDYHSFNCSGNITIESLIFFHDDYIEYYESKMIPTNNLRQNNIKTYHLIIYKFPEWMPRMSGGIGGDLPQSTIIEHEYIYEYRELELL
tara:strand:- start:393 stop:734 length:342 start_codon:yes stop_codon:yes gene_type:complete